MVIRLYPCPLGLCKTLAPLSCAVLYSTVLCFVVRVYVQKTPPALQYMKRERGFFVVWGLCACAVSLVVWAASGARAGLGLFRLFEIKWSITKVCWLAKVTRTWFSIW